MLGHHAAVLDDEDAGPREHLGGTVVTDAELEPDDVRTPRQGQHLSRVAGQELGTAEHVDDVDGLGVVAGVLLCAALTGNAAVALNHPALIEKMDHEYEQRRQTFDFDMLRYQWSESLSPGNEQSFYWGSAAADEPGSRNYMGVRSKAIDAMIGALLAAENREDFVAAVRALDRVLMSGLFVVPLFHLPEQWVARWTHIQRPATTSLFGYLPETWWHQPPAR